eukprot:9811103-Ditylum_brightwellii.AAC.1
MSIEISKPDEGDLEDIDVIRLNTPVPDMVMKMNWRKKGKKGRAHHGMMLKEWKKRNKILMTTREKGTNYLVLTSENKE